MAELSDEDFEAANERGRELFVNEPHAKSVRYDRDAGMVVVELYNGCVFAFPPRLLQGFENATEAQIAEVETSPYGFGLHWETLDADFTVRGLMRGSFGNEAFMARHRERMRTILAQIEARGQHAAA